MNTDDLLAQIPKGWIIHECGQSPLHALWHCTLFNLDAWLDQRGSFYVVADEIDTFPQALSECLRKLKSGKVLKID